MTESIKWVVREVDEELLEVSNDTSGRGKMVAYFTPTEPGTADTFNVGLSWKSIEALHKRMSRQVFDWATNDGSLTISGRDGGMSIRFISQPTGLTVDIALTTEEQQSLKDALFNGLRIEST